MRLLKLLCVALLSAASAFAAASSPDKYSKEYLTLESAEPQVDVYPIETSMLKNKSLSSLPSKQVSPSMPAYSVYTSGYGLNGYGPTGYGGLVGTEMGQNIMIIDQIVNITTKIWDIIERNQPVLNISNQYATAVPKGIASWMHLTGWQGPKGAVYRVRWKNLYGMNVVDLRYMVTYQSNGSYKGRGQFLTAVSVEPLNLDVAWGYKVNLTASVPDSSVVNVGTVDQPVAAMQLVLKYTVSTMVKKSHTTDVFYIRGDGLMRDMSNSSK